MPRAWFILTLLMLGASAAFAQPAPLPRDSKRDCAACHTEWVDDFDRPEAVLLMDRPEKSVAADSDTCLSCHDGSVADSRRAVWVEHGHKTGIKPSAGMKVPETLPLENGKIACRTCHTAHAGPGGRSFADAVFLRGPNDKSQLCQQCHTSNDPSHSHPLGHMDKPAPDKLLSAGARAGADKQTLTCQSCHTAHGSKQENMLVVSADSGQLCITCHTQADPGKWLPDAKHEHPQSPPLQNDAQRKAIADMHTKLGPNDTLVCLSCHKMHKAESPKYILADSLAGSQLCIRCHPDRADLAGSQHDLRKSNPDEKNAKGQIAEQSGPCGACHSFHSYSREVKVAKGDPTGLCTTCHITEPGKDHAADLPLGHPTDITLDRLPNKAKSVLYGSKDGKTEPQLACLTCHDPHQTKQSHFLRGSQEQLCGDCHSNQMAGVTGKHDFSKTNPALHNAKGQTPADAGKCGFCHAVHKSNGPDMWVATKDIPKNGDDMCVQCHRADGLAAKMPASAMRHPAGPTTAPAATIASGLPLFNASGEIAHDGSVACASCHDPHGNTTKSPWLLRGDVSKPADLCVKCHPGQQSLAGGMHDAQGKSKAWQQQGAKQDLCLSCHLPHSNDPARKLWAVVPAPVRSTGFSLPSSSEQPEGRTTNQTDGTCIACHPAKTWAAKDQPIKPGMMLHPQTVGQPSRLSKDAGPAGSPSHTDDIACKTCHNPHASSSGPHLLRVAAGAQSETLCFTCHDASRSVDHTPHGRAAMGVDPKTQPVCGPCHAVHAVQNSKPDKLWAAKEDADGKTQSERHCLGCHGPDGPSSKRPTIVRHAEAPLKNVKWSNPKPSAVEAQVAQTHQITCATCHLPHGRENDPHAANQPAPGVTKPIVRPNVDRDLCARCHGFEGSRLFLYFHRPDKRADIKKLTGDN